MRRMNIDEIRSYKHAKPFTPFDLVLDDGTSVFVADWDRMAISPLGGVMYVGGKNGFDEVFVSRVRSLRLREPAASAESQS